MMVSHDLSKFRHVTPAGSDFFCLQKRLRRLLKEINVTLADFLTALASLITALAALVWAVRRKT